MFADVCTNSQADTNGDLFVNVYMDSVIGSFGGSQVAVDTNVDVYVTVYGDLTNDISGVITVPIGSSYGSATYPNFASFENIVSLTIDLISPTNYSSQIYLPGNTTYSGTCSLPPTPTPTQTLTSTPTGTLDSTTTPTPTQTLTSTPTGNIETTPTVTPTLPLGECFSVYNPSISDYIYVSYIDRDGIVSCTVVAPTETNLFCIKNGTGNSIYPYDTVGCTGSLASAVIQSLVSNCANSGDCITPTPTPTLTVTPSAGVV